MSICPRCGGIMKQKDTGENATSRIDSWTEICSTCALDEAFNWTTIKYPSAWKDSNAELEAWRRRKAHTVNHDFRPHQ